MIKSRILAALVAFGLGTGSAFAEVVENQIEDFQFSFEGPFGTFDKNQLQRGLQIYTEVCAACHGLRQVAFRTLGEHGGPELEEDQVKAYAKLWDIFDPALDDTRPGIPADKFPANTGVGAPDLSLMAKARAGFSGPMGLGINQLVKGMGGAEYIASLLAGYTGKEKTEAGVTLYQNVAFPGGWISMGPPLSDDLIEFADGNAADVKNMAQDVAAFLAWTAEPKQNNRKRIGFVVIALMVLLTSLLYLTNKRLWQGPKRKV